MTNHNSSRPNAAAQFTLSGYVLTDDRELTLRDLFKAMDLVADLMEQNGIDGDTCELFGKPTGALFRSFSRLGQTTLCDSPYAIKAQATQTGKKEPAE